MGTKGRKRKKSWFQKWRLAALAAVLCAGAWWWVGLPADETAAPEDGRGAALRGLKRRAEQGDIPAQIELAEKHCSGTDVKKNVFQCVELYRKAANLGSGTAMLRLGDLYASGDGFILDLEAARMWWRKAEATAEGADGARSRLQPAEKAPTDAVVKPGR